MASNKNIFFTQITQGPDYPSKGALSRFLHPPPYPVIRLLTQFTFKKNCLDADYYHRNQVIEVHASDWSGGQRYFMISLITVVLWWGPLDAGDLEWHGLLVRSGARLKRIARAHLARLAVSTATREWQPTQPMHPSSPTQHALAVSTASPPQRVLAVSTQLAVATAIGTPT